MMIRKSTGALVAAVSLIAAVAHAQTTPAKEFEPTVGQAGKDVVWVPSPVETVERMLDVAKLTPQDFVVDLGSGDGRNIIAAAKRGARGLGVEFNPDMVELSKRNAAREGVADRAQFVQGDMFEADFSKATVLALFLLPSNLERLNAKFLNLTPGTRIVANTFGITGWTADQTVHLGDACTSWCTVLLYTVPAKVGGQWQAPQGTVTIEQTAQTFTGALAGTPLLEGKVNGDRVSFTVGGVAYAGRVAGGRIEGTMTSGTNTTKWVATRAQ